MLLSLATANGIAMASEVTSVQTPAESDDGKESTSVSQQPEMSENEEEAELSVSKDELDCFADGIVESLDITPVKVEIPEICANDQEILDAVSCVADSFNFKLKIQQEESIFNLSKVKMFSCLYHPDLESHCVTICCQRFFISSERKAKRA